jgi:hypothetical protein
MFRTSLARRYRDNSGRSASIHVLFLNLPSVVSPYGYTRGTKNQGGLFEMSEKRELEILSRRKFFSILGLAALSLALPSTTLMVSRAEAQAPSATPEAPSTTPTTGAPQTGRRQRRLVRRQARTERRQARRQARTERRQTRRQARTERRQTRRGTSPATPQ